MSAGEDAMFLETPGSLQQEYVSVLATNLFIYSLFGPRVYLKMEYSSHFCHVVIEPDKISVFSNKTPAQWSFKSAALFTHVNCASCQSLIKISLEH